MSLESPHGDWSVPAFPFSARTSQSPQRHSGLLSCSPSPLPSLLPATIPHPTPVPCAQSPGVPSALSLCTRGLFCQERPSALLAGPCALWSTVVLSGNLPGGCSGKSIFGWDAEPGQGLWGGRPGDSSVGLAWVWRPATGSGQCCCLSDSMPSGTQARPWPL